MKPFNINLTTIITILAIGYCISSCNKKDNIPIPTTPMGRLEFHLHSNVGSNEIEAYGEVYTVSGGRKISIDKAQLYISDIQLVKLDGALYDVADAAILLEQGKEVYFIGNVPVGNYQSVRFYVGLSTVTNQKIATSTDTLINKSEMWFGSTAQANAYVFVNFQGTIDTSTAANAVNLVPFKYKIGTLANRKQVKMPNKNYTIVANQTEFVHMEVDYNQLFEGIQTNTASNLILTTTADNTNGLSAKLIANIPSMFIYE